MVTLHPVHAQQQVAVEALRPRAVKRQRGSAGRHAAWGGFSAVREAALSLSTDSSSAECGALQGGALALMVAVHRHPIFVAGRYTKASRRMPQSPWTGDNGEQVGHSSVQEELLAALLPVLQADDAHFVPAGREDMDVRMRGMGRPFVLEVLNAKRPQPAGCAWGPLACACRKHACACHHAGCSCTVVRVAESIRECQLAAQSARRRRMDLMW